MRNIKSDIDDAVWDKIRVPTNITISTSNYVDYYVNSKYQFGFMNGNYLDTVRVN